MYELRYNEKKNNTYTQGTGVVMKYKKNNAKEDVYHFNPRRERNS